MEECQREPRDIIAAGQLPIKKADSRAPDFARIEAYRRKAARRLDMSLAVAISLLFHGTLLFLPLAMPWSTTGFAPEEPHLLLFSLKSASREAELDPVAVKPIDPKIAEREIIERESPSLAQAAEPEADREATPIPLETVVPVSADKPEFIADEPEPATAAVIPEPEPAAAAIFPEVASAPSLALPETMPAAPVALPEAPIVAATGTEAAPSDIRVVETTLAVEKTIIPMKTAPIPAPALKPIAAAAILLAPHKSPRAAVVPVAPTVVDSAKAAAGEGIPIVAATPEQVADIPPVAAPTTAAPTVIAPSVVRESAVAPESSVFQGATPLAPSSSFFSAAFVNRDRPEISPEVSSDTTTATAGDTARTSASSSSAVVANDQGEDRFPNRKNRSFASTIGKQTFLGAAGTSIVKVAPDKTTALPAASMPEEPAAALDEARSIEAEPSTPSVAPINTESAIPALSHAETASAASEARPSPREVLDLLAGLVAERKAYPEAARRRKAQGAVGLSLQVTAEGSLAVARVEKKSGSAILDRAALDLVKGLFPLALRPGTSMEIALTIEYRLVQ